MRTFLTVLLFCVTTQAFALTPSQIRQPNETWQEAAEKHLSLSDLARGEHSLSARAAAGALRDLKLSEIPKWNVSQNVSQMQAEFERVRDLRFLILPEMRDFLRRIPWLYPDDGCYMRAEAMGEEIEKGSFPRPKKLFIFGDLSLRTRNSPDHWIYWWYHVAPVIYENDQSPQIENEKDSDLGLDRVYVFDPAIEPRHPLRLKAWIRSLGSNFEDAKLSLCDPTAYEPSSNCLGPTSNSAQRAQKDAPRFLRAEWYRLKDLDRNPRQELGEDPPWKRAERKMTEGKVPVAKRGESVKLELNGPIEDSFTALQETSPASGGNGEARER
jgi:hypothetical protein